MAIPQIGANADLLVEPGGSATGPAGYTFSATSERYEFIRETMQAITPTVERDGFRGVRSLPALNIKRGARQVGGSIVLNPGPADLALWLPRIMRGGGPTVDTYSLGDLNDDTVKFGVMIDRVNDVFVYDNCQIARATFRGSAGQLVEMQLDIIGQDEGTVNVTGIAGFPSPAPTWNVGATAQPYIYHEGALALTAVPTADDPFDFELVVDNALQPRFVFSQTATEFATADRIVTFTMNMPYDADHKNLYRQSEVVTPAGGALTFTNGTLNIAFQFQHLQGGDASPTVNTKGELRLAVPFRARASGLQTAGVFNQDEVVVVNDATP